MTQILFQNASVLDAERGTLVPDRSVLVENAHRRSRRFERGAGSRRPHDRRPRPGADARIDRLPRARHGGDGEFRRDVGVVPVLSRRAREDHPRRHAATRLHHGARRRRRRLRPGQGSGRGTRRRTAADLRRQGALADRRPRRWPQPGPDRRRARLLVHQRHRAVRWRARGAAGGARGDQTRRPPHQAHAQWRRGVAYRPR